MSEAESPFAAVVAADVVVAQLSGPAIGEAEPNGAGLGETTAGAPCEMVTVAVAVAVVVVVVAAVEAAAADELGLDEEHSRSGTLWSSYGSPLRILRGSRSRGGFLAALAAAAVAAAGWGK